MLHMKHGDGECIKFDWERREIDAMCTTQYSTQYTHQIFMDLWYTYAVHKWNNDLFAILPTDNCESTSLDFVYRRQSCGTGIVWHAGRYNRIKSMEMVFRVSGICLRYTNACTRLLLLLFMKTKMQIQNCMRQIHAESLRVS